MGRKSKFTEAELFRSVARLHAGASTPTIAEISAASGVSTGSIYHRYGSREGLLARTWLAVLADFQSRFLAALDAETAEAGMEAALTTPRYCRDNPEMALLLVRMGRESFSGAGTPEDIRQSIAAGNDALRAAVQKFARRMALSPERGQLALVGMPLACVRLYMPAKPVADEADEMVRQCYRALLAPGAAEPGVAGIRPL